MAKNQRLGINSAVTLTSAMQGALSDDVPLPDGVKLRGDDEMIIWGQFTSIRQRSDWRDFDLLLLAKAVRAESDIRAHQTKLDRTGPLLKTDRGTPIANPLISIIDSLQRLQLSIITKLSMNQQPVDPRTMSGAGARQIMYKNKFDELDDDLIARPR